MNDNQFDRLVHAYQRMAERARHRLDQLEQAEQRAVSQLRESIEHAAEQAVELDELTREEARLVAGYLRRDLEDAGHYLASSGRELRDWLKFDVEYVEDRILEWFSNIADRTKLELLNFNAEVERAGHYYTGDVTGPGTLRCDNCGHQLTFSGADRVPSCPSCHGTIFSRSRVGGNDDDNDE